MDSIRSKPRGCKLYSDFQYCISLASPEPKHTCAHYYIPGYSSHYIDRQTYLHIPEYLRG